MSDLKEKKDVAELFSLYAADLTYEALPPEVISVLKRVVLDTLGTTLAANTLGEGVQPLIELARDMGGRPESTILGFTDKVPAAMAAFVNGGMAQALNYADTAELGGHLGPTAVPAALAVAERVGKVNGKEFLTALAAGTELLCRLSTAFKLAWGDWPVKPLRTQLWGYFSAAASASRIMKLDTEQTHSALGLALMQASGSMQVVRGGDPAAKSIYAAFPNYGGVLGALLSHKGLGARFSRVFEGEAGLFSIFHESRYQESVLHGDWGQKFYLLRVRFKPWPVSGVAHSLLAAALQLVNNQGLDAEQISHVELKGGPDISHCVEPEDVRKKPPTGSAAANSIFFPVAKVLVNKTLRLSDFTPQGLRQPEVLRLTDRMSYSIEGTLGSSGIVEVRMSDGSRHVVRVDTPLGHLSNPMEFSDLVEKFSDCASYAARPLAKARVEEVVRLIEGLEHVPDISILPKLVNGMA